MAWTISPSDDGAYSCINFSQGAHADVKKREEQFPWMSLQVPSGSRYGMSGKITPLTSAGCCMAFTVYFFDWYRNNPGGNVSDYFKWLQTVKGISSVMNLQTKYLGWDTPIAEGPVNTQSKASRTIDALRRKVEDQTYGQFRFRAVKKPTFPSEIGSLGSEVMVDFSGKYPCVYKPIYLANVGGDGHAIGAILDYGNSNFLFFDSNEGLASFSDATHMKTWLKRVTTAEYKDQYTAFFADTKVPG